MRIPSPLSALALSLALASCNLPQPLPSSSSSTGLLAPDRLGWNDWQVAVDDLVGQLLIDDLTWSRVGWEPGGEPLVMRLSRIRDSTGEVEDLAPLTHRVREVLRRSGRVVTTAAVGSESDTDPAIREDRLLRDDPHFDQTTVQGENQLHGPRLSLSGEILYAETVVGREHEHWFAIRLILTDLATGVIAWEGEKQFLRQEGGPSWSRRNRATEGEF